MRKKWYLLRKILWRQEDKELVKSLPETDSITACDDLIKSENLLGIFGSEKLEVQIRA